MKLSDNMVRGLRTIAEAGDRGATTSNRNRGPFVADSTAEALHRRGLVVRERMVLPGGGCRVYRLSDAGRTFLGELDLDLDGPAR